MRPIIIQSVRNCKPMIANQRMFRIALLQISSVLSLRQVRSGPWNKSGNFHSQLKSLETVPFGSVSRVRLLTIHIFSSRAKMESWKLSNARLVHGLLRGSFERKDLKFKVSVSRPREKKKRNPWKCRYRDRRANRVKVMDHCEGESDHSARGWEREGENMYNERYCRMLSIFFVASNGNLVPFVLRVSGSSFVMPRLGAIFHQGPASSRVKGSSRGARFEYYTLENS